jgi:FkbM family methyltransferase
MMSSRIRKAWKRYFWLRLLRLLHPIKDVRTNNNRLVRVDLRDEFISPALYLTGEVDAHLLNLIGCMDLKGSVCLDIGANLGMFSLAMSEAVGKDGVVHAFEPEAYNFNLLCHNLKVNNAVNVLARPVAIGDSVGSCSIAIAEDNLGDHQVIADGTNDRRLQRAEMQTVDSLLSDVPAGAVKLIKIDVQGYEYRVVNGMRETLRRNPDVILMIEVGPGRLRKAGSSVSALLKFFADEDFKGWEFHDYRISPIADAWVYELFPGVREEDLILCQNYELLMNAFSAYYRQPLPISN